MKPFNVLFVLAAVSLSATIATAQTDSRVAVSGSVGAATDSADTGVAAGGALLFDVHERISLEGQGTYLRRGEGADAFNVSGSVLVNLLPASEAIVPYGAVGAGIYRVSFDLDRPRFLGPTGTQFAAGSRVCPAPGSGFGFGPGAGLGSGSATCTGNVGYWGVGDFPNFYARRLGALPFPRGGTWGARDFTDPVVNVGAGVRLNVTDRLMVRPDARALIVFAEGETHTVGVFVVHVGYRF
jgi:hypothetical protein